MRQDRAVSVRRDLVAPAFASAAALLALAASAPAQQGTAVCPPPSAHRPPGAARIRDAPRR